MRFAVAALAIAAAIHFWRAYSPKAPESEERYQSMPAGLEVRTEPMYRGEEQRDVRGFTEQEQAEMDRQREAQLRSQAEELERKGMLKDGRPIDYNEAAKHAGK